MSNLKNAFLQSFILGIFLIFIAYLINGGISLPELILSLSSVYILFGSYNFLNFLKNKT